MLWRRVTGQDIISCDIKNAEKSVVALAIKYFRRKLHLIWLTGLWIRLWTRSPLLQLFFMEFLQELESICGRMLHAWICKATWKPRILELSETIIETISMYILLWIIGNKISYTFANNNANNIAKMVFAEKYLGTRREFVEVFCQWRHSDVFIVNFEQVDAGWLWAAAVNLLKYFELIMRFQNAGFHYYEEN